MSTQSRGATSQVTMSRNGPMTKVQHTVDGPEDEEPLSRPIIGGKEEDEEWCEEIVIEQDHRKYKKIWLPLSRMKVSNTFFI